MTSNSLEYARRLLDNTRHWYDNADLKAQVILALDGIFLAFIASSMFQYPQDLRSIFSVITMWTIGWLGLMVFSLIGSVFAALYCIWSRIYRENEVARLVQKAELRDSSAPYYPPEIVNFFQFLEVLEVEKLQATLQNADETYELQALVHEMRILARNVRRKHTAVNIGFALAAASLLFFLLAGASYMIAGVS